MKALGPPLLREDASWLARQAEVIRVCGLGRWLWFSVRGDEAWAWCERVIYCHHNARVLCEMEYRFGCTLNYCTKGMSKAYYELDDIYVAIDEWVAERVEEGIEEACEDGELAPVKQGSYR